VSWLEDFDNSLDKSLKIRHRLIFRLCFIIILYTSTTSRRMGRDVAFKTGVTPSFLRGNVDGEVPFLGPIPAVDERISAISTGLEGV